MKPITCLNSAALCFVLSACSGGGGGGGGGNSPTPASPASPPSATATITSDMNAAYSNDQTAFASDAQALVRRLASNGQACGGAMYIDLANLKVSHVQTFVANAVAIVQTNEDLGFSIDTTAIISLFNGFQTGDLAWLTSYTWSNCGISAALLNQLATTFNPAVNSAYSAAVAQIAGPAAATPTVPTVPASPASPPSATATITSYMSAAYSTDQAAFASDAQALVRSLAANGQLCGGAMYIDIANLKVSHVQTFVANVVAAVQTNKNLGDGIDKAAIISLFNGYRTGDLAWLTSYTWSNCVVSQAILNELATTFNPAVTSAYSTAVAQINLM